MNNLMALDLLAKSHLQFDAKCARAATEEHPESLDDEHVAVALTRARALVMAGRVEDAWRVCEAVCACPIEDPRLQLRVRIHHLFELLHAAHAAHEEAARRAGLERAVCYSRELAEFALNSFPEAYGIFTNEMLLFAYPERVKGYAALFERRKELANEIVALTQAVVGARESSLSFLVRYLLLIYAQRAMHNDGDEELSDNVQDLMVELLLTDDDADESAAEAKRMELRARQEEKRKRVAEDGDCSEMECTYEESLLQCNIRDTEMLPGGMTGGTLWRTDGVRPVRYGCHQQFDEADVQSLPDRVRINRREAVESLRFTNGDADAALRNELGRVVINRSRLRRMVVEYCAMRGLKAFEYVTPSSSKMFSSTSSEGTTKAGLPSVSENSNRLLIEKSEVPEDIQTVFAAMYRLRRLADSGNFDEFVAAVCEIEPSLLASSPQLHFRMRQCQLWIQLRNGDTCAALEIARTKLGPLAEENADLREALSETAMLLAYPGAVHHPNDVSQYCDEDGSGSRAARAGEKRPRGSDKSLPDSDMYESDMYESAAHGEEAPSAHAQLLAVATRALAASSLESVAEQTYHALGQRWREPELAKLLRVTLTTHSRWLAQNMMPDRFAAWLGIDSLRGDTRGGGSGGAPGGAPAAYPPSSNARAEPAAQRETLVIKLMEVLAVSRADALAHIRRHPGARSAQDIIEAVFAQMR